MTNLYRASVYLLLFILGLAPVMVHGQTTSVGNWQLGLGIGSTNYYGDLSNYRINGLKNIGRLLDYNKYYVDQPSFTVLVHKKLTPTLGFMIQANNLQFAMSDRYRKKNGSIDSGAMNYSRSLNFKTNLQDVGIAFSFSPNNGRIGPEDVFFYPSFFLGVGVSKFTVKGDLYDENNNPYNYRLPGNIMDGTYETNLRDLRTETDSKFRNVEPYVDLGLALNFRINQNLTIALQSDIKYSASDYLDDVSMKYKTSYATAAEAYAAKPGYNIVDPITLKRGDDNGMNDFFINNRIVLHIGLSKKAAPKKFNPPVIYSLNAPYVQQRKNLEFQKKVQDSLVREKADSTLKAKRDSLISDSIRLKQSLQVPTDTNVQKQLNSISSQLQEIKTFLRDQQSVPRRQQLQYQSDSLKTLRNRILNQRSTSREDNLRVRIYGLQLDSLQNEMNRLNWNGGNPARTGDSMLRYYNQPGLPDQLPPSNPGVDQAISNVQSLQVQAKADSIYQADIRAWENEVRDLKKDNRYNSDAAYKKTVDSLQKKLTEYRRKDKVTRVSPNPGSGVQESSQQADVQSEGLSLENQRKLDSLQERLDSLERLSADSAASASTNIDSLQRLVRRDSIAGERAINELTRQQQLRADSVALLRRQLQRSADSVTFYQQQLPATRDTVVQQKKKWYQNIFRRGRNKKEVSTVNDPSSTDVYMQREQEHNEQLNTTRARIEQLERDSVNEANASLQNQTLSEQQITRLQTQLKHNADSVAMMRRRLQQSNDSAAYYKTLYANEEVVPDNRQSAKWYQDIFTSEKKMKKKRESEESSRNRIAEQERYYDDAAVAMRRQIEELENRNKEIERDYVRLNSARTRLNDVSPPIVVYDNNRNNRSDYSNSEISSLRSEIERLRNQVNNNPDNTQPLFVQPAPQLPVSANITPAQPATDTTQVNNLRSELSAIRSQLDSLRNRPVPVAEKVTPKENTFDPSSFPVISVYFKMGAVTLPQDQLNKILPFGQVASKNNNTNIVLKGFTDPIGNPATNITIANKRTDYVKNFLVSRFKIDRNRITVEEPSVSELSKSQKPNPLDRRVDMNLTN